jgi:reactive intermediate/imine deaminase
MSKHIISTDQAPQAIGTYSQAVKVGNTVYMSGQIGLDPATMQLVEGIEAQVHRVFKNLQAVAEASGGSLGDVVKLNVFLTDLGNFALVNTIMADTSASRIRHVLLWAWLRCPKARWWKPTLCW